jgi:HK97 gp10 family phage protein
MSVTLTGNKQLLANLRKFGAAADKYVADVVNGTAQNIRTTAIRSIQRGTKSGVVYQKYAPNRTHQASAPGQAPASDTGRLANSITADIEGKQATVTAGTEYAAPLEFGTRDIEPRPFMVPAMEQERPKFNARLQKIVDAGTKGLLK